MQAATALSKVFAANRSAGRIALSVHAEHGTTRRREIYEDGPLRIRFPHAFADALEAILVNTSGGIAGGDRHDIDIAVGEHAALRVTTAAAEKVYCALGPPADISIKLSVGAGGRLAWLPEETILFDRARLDRRIDIELAAGGSLLMAEAIVFGRKAMDEAVEEGTFNDRWRIRRDGQLIFAETARLDGAIQTMLAEPAVAAGGIAIATMVSVPADEDKVARVRGLSFRGEVGISAWNGLAVARFCAKDGADLRRDVAAVITALGGVLPRLWLN